MSLRAIASGIPTEGIKFIEYYHTKTVDSESGLETHSIIVKLNRHIYVGKYTDTTQADAYTKAKEVVKGFLTKSGCTDPDTRLPNVPYREYGFDAPAQLTDVTPDSVTWGNLTYQDMIGAYLAYTEQITGISTPITLQLLNQTNGNIQFYYKVNQSGVVGSYLEFDTGPYTPLANNGTFVVNNNEFVTFITGPTTGWKGSQTSVSVSISNVTDNSTVIATFQLSISN